MKASIARKDIMKKYKSRMPHSSKRDRTSLAVTMVACLMITLTAGCDVEDRGVVRNEVPLPTDSILNFACEDEGIFPEDCVLENPDNPYRTANVTDDTKFALSDDAPSAKSRYYVWATALARQPTGENQFFTALSLHEVFGESTSPTTREQAIKAYRSVLDNFFFSATFFVVSLAQGDAAVATALKDTVGRNLVEPARASLVPLYSAPLLAQDAISSWGYIYELPDPLDPLDTGTMSFFE
jgi:hypothetical protein